MGLYSSRHCSLCMQDHRSPALFHHPWIQISECQKHYIAKILLSFSKPWAVSNLTAIQFASSKIQSCKIKVLTRLNILSPSKTKRKITWSTWIEFSEYSKRFLRISEKYNRLNTKYAKRIFKRFWESKKDFKRFLQTFLGNLLKWKLQY